MSCTVTLLKFSVISLQVEQALFKSLLASDTWQITTRTIHDNRSSSRSLGPTDGIFSPARVSYQDTHYRPITSWLFISVEGLNGLHTSKRAVLSIPSKITLSMQSITGQYLHAGCRGRKKRCFQISASASWKNCGLP